MTISTHPFVTRVEPEPEPEPEHDKPCLMSAIDELVTGPLDSFHIERMTDDTYWVALSKGDVRQVIAISSVSGRAKIVARTEAD